MLIDPRRKQQVAARARNTVGRWCLLSSHAVEETKAKAELHEQQLASACWTLLARYGVVFRDVLARETTNARWRDLLPMFRRLEAQGQVRGGRFLSGFGGEQFALPEAVESLRACRRQNTSEVPVTIAAADPMNLVGIVVPGERPVAIPGRTVTFLRGQFLAPEGTESDKKAVILSSNTHFMVEKTHFLHQNGALFASETGHD
jgi:ATP-dependent Lhr-like helicase